MNCKECQAAIDYADSLTTLDSRAEAHIGSCGGCRTFYAERRSLRDLVGGLEPVTAPLNYDYRLRARIAEGAGVQHRSGLFGPLPATLTTAALATVVVGVGLLLFGEGRQPRPLPPSEKLGIVSAPASTSHPEPVTAARAEDRPVIAATRARPARKSPSKSVTVSTYSDTMAVEAAPSERVVTGVKPLPIAPAPSRGPVFLIAPDPAPLAVEPSRGAHLVLPEMTEKLPPAPAQNRRQR